MAIIHYDVIFKKNCPTLEKIKSQIDQRMGLNTRLMKDVVEVAHAWPYLGMVRESGTLECAEAADSDMEITVGSTGVRISCVPSSTHPYFREIALAALLDLGGSFDAKLDSFVGKQWNDLSAAEKKGGWRAG